MIPFIYIDGPLAGTTLLSDFRTQRYLKEIYHKYTYAALVKEEESGVTWRMWIDVATIKSPPNSIVGIPFIESEFENLVPPSYLRTSIRLPYHTIASKLQTFTLKDLQVKPHRINKGVCRFCKQDLETCKTSPLCIKVQF